MTGRDGQAKPAACSRAALEESVRLSLRRVGVSTTGPVLAAVSGGADSTALLLALERTFRRGKQRVLACYVDHGLRSAAEIAAERQSLATLCAGLQVPLVVERANLKAVPAGRSGRRRSPEEIARIARYAVLRHVAERYQATVVATGHTADDQAETVLLRLLRGSGPAGLAGIREASHPWGNAAPLLWRPLLGRRRVDTEGYCLACGVPWSTDSSNSSGRFLRNRVRAELMPVIEALRPGAVGSIARLAGQAADLAGWLQAEVGVWEARLARPVGTGLLLLRPEVELPPYLAAQLIATLLARLMQGAGAPSERVVHAALTIWTGPDGRRVALGRGWSAVATPEGMRLFEAKRGCTEAGAVVP